MLQAELVQPHEMKRMEENFELLRQRRDFFASSKSELEQALDEVTKQNRLLDTRFVQFKGDLLGLNRRLRRLEESLRSLPSFVNESLELIVKDVHENMARYLASGNYLLDHLSVGDRPAVIKDPRLWMVRGRSKTDCCDMLKSEFFVELEGGLRSFSL